MNAMPLMSLVTSPLMPGTGVILPSNGFSIEANVFWKLWVDEGGERVAISGPSIDPRVLRKLACEGDTLGKVTDGRFLLLPP
jgi:hypothetical protein